MANKVPICTGSTVVHHSRPMIWLGWIWWCERCGITTLGENAARETTPNGIWKPIKYWLRNPPKRRYAKPRADEAVVLPTL